METILIFDHPLSFYVLANCAVLLGAIVQASTGMAFAMIAAPLLALISLDLVPGPVIFINLFLSLLMLRDGRADIVGQEVNVLIPAIAFGTVIAATILVNVPGELFGVLFAVLILLAVAVSLFLRMPGLSFSTLTFGGLVAGIMGTTAGISGPPLAVLYQREDITKTRATLALVFTFSYIASLIALAYTGRFNAKLAVDGLLLLPGLLAGFFIAKRVRDKLSNSLARILMLSISTVGALLLLIKSL